MANKERLYQVLDWIKANPDHWDQTNWHCGTSHCFAGVAQLMMHKLDPASEVVRVFGEGYYCGSLKLSFINSNQGCYIHDWLGISKDDSTVLFHEDNTLSDLECIVADLCKDLVPA